MEKKKSRKVAMMFGKQKIMTDPMIAKKIKSGELSPDTHMVEKESGMIVPRKKAVVGGSGILPSATSNTAMKAGITNNASTYKAGIPSDAGQVKGAASAGIPSNAGQVKGAASAGIPKSQVDAKLGQVADTLAPYKQKSMQAASKLMELTAAIENATTMEEINAINEQIKAFQLENASGE
jgi:hypothetical protein